VLRKIIVLGIAALALAMVVPSLASADVKGPQCNDIVGGSGTYGATGQLNFTLELAEAACKQFNYTYFVQLADGTVVELAPHAQTPDGMILAYQGQIDPAANETICVWATSSAGNHVFDRAPDTGCFTIARSSSPGFTGFS
jgi:hypothetical protein